MPNWLRDLSQDLLYAARLLRKSRGFVATAVPSGEEPNLRLHKPPPRIAPGARPTWPT